MAAVTPAAAALPIVFASTAGVPPRNTLGTAGHSYPDALAHGITYEGDALERLSTALGTHIFPATTESVCLAGRVVRARPDGCNRRANPLDSTVIFEVKCPSVVEGDAEPSGVSP